MLSLLTQFCPGGYFGGWGQVMRKKNEKKTMSLFYLVELLSELSCQISYGGIMTDGKVIQCCLPGYQKFYN